MKRRDSGPQLVGWSLDTPTKGTFDSFAVEISGWILGKHGLGPLRLQPLIHERYPAGRELTLIRELSDTTCSMLALIEKRGSGHFPHHDLMSDEEFVARIGDSAVAFDHHYRRQADQASLIRYENLVLHPHKTVAAIRAWLGVESDTGVLHRLLADASVDEPEMRHNWSTRDPRSSIGRRREDLPAALRATTERKLADVLAALTEQ